MVARATTSPNFASPEGEGFPPSPEETLNTPVPRILLLGNARDFSIDVEKWLSGGGCHAVGQTTILTKHFAQRFRQFTRFQAQWVTDFLVELFSRDRFELMNGAISGIAKYKPPFGFSEEFPPSSTRGILQDSSQWPVRS